MQTARSEMNIVWFKRDLRIYDHRPLRLAADEGAVYPLYVIEPRLWLEPDMSPRHYAFIRDSLLELRSALAKLGAPLIVRVGEIVDILADIYRVHGEFTVFSHEETGNGWTYRRDRAVGAWCDMHGIAWNEIPQNGVIRRLRTRDGWAAKWERRMREPLALPPTTLLPVPVTDIGRIPAISELSYHAATATIRPSDIRGIQPGGRRAGNELLSSFFGPRGKRYHRELSSPLTATEACSRLSPHLAYGTLSLREVVQETRLIHHELDRQIPGTIAYGESIKERTRAFTAFLSRLRWHCHFIQKLESEPRIEFENLHRSYNVLRIEAIDIERLDAWRRGRTGIPFVDACMRSLLATGWINFRMRAMLCAFASFHLWLHWREPALHLARSFTDYEPGIHYAQMQMQSGTTGINTIRMYNPVKQGYDQDRAGIFLRRWCPELAGIPDERIHEPWTIEETEARSFGVRLGDNYPRAIVDHTQAAREARHKIWSVRGGPVYRTEAEAVQDRHGSRKSGMPQSRVRKAISPQLALFATDESASEHDESLFD